MQDIIQAVEKLMLRIAANHERNFCGGNKEKAALFRTTQHYDITKKYIALKMYFDDTVWGYVLLADDGKFQRGDVFSVNAAGRIMRDKARGNVFGRCAAFATGPDVVKDINPRCPVVNENPEKGQYYRAICATATCDNAWAIFWDIPNFAYYCADCAHKVNVHRFAGTSAKPSIAKQDELYEKYMQLKQSYGDKWDDNDATTWRLR